MQIKTIIKSPELAPAYAKPGDAGMDLKADIPDMVIVCPNEKIKIGTGVRMAIPKGYEGNIRSRSGHFGKGLIADGTIDSSYRGEIMVVLWNVSKELIPIYPLERIAQMVISPFAMAELVPVDELDETDRGDGGFGHTGK